MVIVGLGIDIVEFLCFEKGDGVNEGFVWCVLIVSEWVIFVESKMLSCYFVKCFVVKEVMVKVLGIGIGNGVSW